MPENGEWPASELAIIPGGTALGGNARIAKALLPGVIGLQAAWFHHFKYPLRPVSPNDAYRPLQSQINVFLDRYRPQASGYGRFNDARTWNGVRYVRVKGASASVPGKSNHGFARAIDWETISTAEHRWLMANAPKFGWVNPLWARDDIASNGSKEPWHWEGVVVPVSNYRNVPGVGDIDIPDVSIDSPDALKPKEDEDDMAALLRLPNGTIALVDGDATFEVLVNTAEVESYLSVPGLVKQVPEGNPSRGAYGSLQLSDSLIWDSLAAVAARKAAKSSGDPRQVAASLAATLVPTIVANLPKSSGGTGLTQEQVRVTVEDTIKDVLGSLND